MKDGLFDNPNGVNATCSSTKKVEKNFDVRSRQNVSQGKKRAREATFPTWLLGSQVWQGIPVTPPT
ncbi:hypothetical protein [Pseudomonas putida]